MRLLFISIILIGFLTLAFSCKKTEEKQKEIYAGIYDNEFIYREISPPLVMEIKWDSLNLYGFGNDSIDLDRDGHYDLVMNIGLLNEDSIHLIQGYPDPFPYLALTPKKDLQIAIEFESYYIGLGQYAVASFAFPFTYQQRIDTITNWQKPNDGAIAMWATNPGSGMTPPFGNWYYAHETRYLGFKLAGKIGWLEVDNTDIEHPLFKSYVYLK